MSLHDAIELANFSRQQAIAAARKSSDAVAQFSEVASLNPADKAAKLYLERCRHLAEHPPGDEWNGVWVMESK